MRMTQGQISRVHTQLHNWKLNVQHWTMYMTDRNRTPLDRKQKNEQHLESSTPFTCFYEFKSKKPNQKPYLFKKLKFAIICTENTNKPKYQLG